MRSVMWCWKKIEHFGIVKQPVVCLSLFLSMSLPSAKCQVASVCHNSPKYWCMPCVQCSIHENNLSWHMTLKWWYDKWDGLTSALNCMFFFIWTRCRPVGEICCCWILTWDLSRGSDNNDKQQRKPTATRPTCHKLSKHKRALFHYRILWQLTPDQWILNKRPLATLKLPLQISLVTVDMVMIVKL